MEATLNTLSETVELGRRLGALLESQDVVGLIGPLGVGKTAFVAGVARGFGVDSGFPVTSPTFVLAHQYPGRMPLYHIDLYRVETEQELRGAGLEEMVGGRGAAVVEWFDRFPSLWTSDRLEVRFGFEPGQARRIEATGVGKRGRELERRLAGDA